MGRQITEFIRLLKKTASLTRQQFRTLRGQATHGDLVGAMKGYEQLRRRVAQCENQVMRSPPALFKSPSGSQNCLDFHPLLSDRCPTKTKEAKTMTIQTNTEDRRTMVQQISEHLQAEAHYQGVPSCSYIIGPVTVARDGSITCEDEDVLTSLRPFLIEKGYIEQESDLLAIEVPTEGMDSKQLRNLIHMLYGYQHVLNRVTRQESFSVSEAVIARLGEALPEAAGEFESLMEDFKAGGDLSGIDFRDGTVTLTFPLDQLPEKNKAYADLTGAVIKAARKAARVYVRERRPENEKFVLYSWLLRLGFGGPDFKATRRALLDGLVGHTAFPNDAAANKHKERCAEIRRIARACREGEVR